MPAMGQVVAKWLGVQRRQQVSMAGLPLRLAGLTLLILTASLFTGKVALWQASLLGIFFLLLSATTGWRVGTLFLPLAPLFLWVSNRSGDLLSVADHVSFALAAVLAVLAGHLLFTVRRGTQRRAYSSERRATLLQEAAIELNQAADIDSLYRRAPRLLSDVLAFTHAEIIVPYGDELRVHTAWNWQVHEGFTFPLKSISGRAYTTGESQYVPDTRLDADFFTAPDAKPTLSEYALPIRVNGRVCGVLNLEHDAVDAFSEEVRASLGAYVRMMEEVLERLEATRQLEKNQLELKAFAELGERLLLTEGVAEAAGAALDILLPVLRADSGAFLRLSHGRLRALAVGGTPSNFLAASEKSGLPLKGEFLTAWQTCKPAFLDNADGDPYTLPAAPTSLAIMPLSSPNAQVHSLLLLERTSEPTPWTERQRLTLSRAIIPISAALERATVNRQLVTMVEVVRQLSESKGPGILYRSAAEAVLELIPGAEGVTILVKQEELYFYEAAIDWDLAELQAKGGPFTREEVLKWYSAGEEAFNAGRPRTLTGDAVAAHSHGRELVGGWTNERSRPPILSQLMVPIVGNDEIVGILNVDNFSTTDAFGPTAEQLAESLARQITVLVRQVEQMVDLERSAVTDSLTGLGNREGFERVMRNELARARRYEHHLSLVIVDLNNFKRVNDTYGHAVGDETLQRVADTLRSSRRGSDVVFRWGGDEFVLLLPEVTPFAASAAVERFVTELAKIEVGEIRLGASAGLATYPNDGLDAAALMAQADRRMYEDKERLTVPRSGSDATDA